MPDIKKRRIISILEKARDYITPPGMWCQGELFKARATDTPSLPKTSSNIPCCAMGALGIGAGEHPHYFKFDSPGERARVALQDAVPKGFDTVVHYNDFKGRTQEEILSLFNTAISTLEGEIDHA